MNIETENGIQMTLDQWMPEAYLTPIVGVSGSHAKTLARQTQAEKDLREIVHLCFSELCTWLDNSQKKKDPLTCSLRTLKICLVLMEDGISPGFSLRWTGGGYDAEWQVFNSKDFGVPQNRERVFIIGFLRGKRTTTLLSEAGMGAEIVQREGVHDPQRTPIYIGVGKPMKKDFVGAIIANYKTVGRRERTYICENNNLRFFTPKECFRLQGWTDDYFEKAQLVNSDSQLYRQAGNGVTVNVIKAIAEQL